MDPLHLSGHAQELYRTIRKQHDADFDFLKLADGVQLHLLKVARIEQMLAGEDPLKGPKAFPFWAKLWEAAIVLAQFMVSQHLPSGTTVLELGAGLGAPGLAAAAMGCAVTLTDYETLALDFAKVSAAASGLDSVRFELLDWLSPPQMERRDVILGAEILFREEFFDPLLSIMRQALKPDGVVYLAHDSRRLSLRPFLHRAEKDYAISVSRRTLKGIDQTWEVLLTRLTLR